ncbi:hypothetical protein MKW94_013141 [Papaver nudicaule]|uniref:TF-B3 domain-containing protein n=1 Tax=Papaver nudicaule TaxID=74823 RepID=A0AA41S0S2_PAPNU|nr:hypothetical protein [Papaver nudicaule]
MGSSHACEECSQRCIIIHQGRKDPSPIVTSFFKPMLGDHFSRRLFIPPKFAQSIASLDNQVIDLEDTKGQRWEVKLAEVDGSLAISKGWNRFVIDHSIKLGDVLIFSYVSETHFVVQIYEPSGCEKLIFSGKTPINFDNNTNKSGGKRVKGKGSVGDASRSKRNSSSSKFPGETAGNCSVHEQGSNSTIHSKFDAEILERRKNANDTANANMAAEMASGYHKEKTLQPAPSVECSEVPFYMFDRGAVDRQGTSTSPLFDLSNFETPIKKSGTYAAEKAAPVVLEKETSPRPLTDHKMEEQNHVFNEEAVGKKRGISGISGDIPSADSVYDLEMPEVNCNSKIQDEVQVCADAAEKKKARGHQLVGSPLSLEDHEVREKYHVIDEIPGKSGENNVPPIDIPAAEVHDSECDSEMPERNYNAENENEAADELSGFCENEMGKLKIANTASKKSLLMDKCNALVPNEVALLADHSPQKSSRRVTRSSSSLPPGPGKNPVTMGVKDHQTGKISKAVEKEREKKLKEKQGSPVTIVKPEPEEFEYEACIPLKEENIDYDLPMSPDAANFSTSAPAETQTYLELAVDLPSFSVRGKKASGKSIVVLRDSAMKRWPVVYHERSSFRVLASGWKALAEANNIQKGDTCLISVENASESLLRLEINRK